MINNYDKIIVMAEPETWPSYLKNNTKIEYWEIKYPKGTDLKIHREIRDQLIIKVK